MRAKKAKQFGQSGQGKTKLDHQLSTRWQVDAPFLAWLCLVLLTDKTGLSQWFCFPVVLHEAGHLVMMAILGERPARIRLSFVGIGVQRQNISTTPMREGLILAAGSGMNLLLFLIFGLLYDGNSARLTQLALPHLAVGLFNLLPLSVTDGGRLLTLLLERKLPPTGLRIAQAVGGGVSILLLLVLAFAQLFAGGLSLSLLVTMGYLTVLLFEQ